ncbi:hypothetical protein NJT12_15725 [Flavobacterium sp. AC]|uniref:Uncharacterized protein n=1 Tax=Flavobacterium azizsancarii TaxID=2961580 RepID=A0ABT4WG44_9FLAO|nr:hypothetical protein [Flavobacterium azizsancarii]MDA6071064.1 hypothetical protein [Flavobacterium azizsancarii]
MEEAFRTKTSNPTIVVTQHPPTFINYPDKYADSDINEAFGTEMSN